MTLNRSEGRRVGNEGVRTRCALVTGVQTCALPILDSHGRLLIADFAPHEREELRSRDAHARLGFSDDQIGRWFDQAGFEMEDERTLAGELTVKLWLGRRREAQVLPIKGRTAS